ncbi:MAG: 16S rRNA (cytosine(1402)-N(4))-methyltransferase RsmH [Alphaproteobacteria bacterium]|nr:16S rRNA (cytosine(1402)-N(4))-methyltransferase RsmH [Alphaproteobacteria bacterium]
MKHIPVLLDSVLNALGDIRDKTVIDCTFGAGGYSRAFLERGANVIAFDRDPSVADDANKLKQQYGEKFKFIQSAFSEISQINTTVDAVVFDLGISSMQIDIPDRGFSFRFDAPLDMRMASDGMTAAEYIAQVDAGELTRVLREYGDMKNAGGIARAIKAALPKTTFQLRDLIHNPHDYAPVFQALRIAVNDEMGELERALAVVPDLLKIGGMCLCVTFHSLEDRIVKNTFRDWTTVPGDPRMPIVADAPFKLVRVVQPSAEEITENPRARSAHMRGVIKSY